MVNRRFKCSEMNVVLRPNDFDADKMLNNSIYLTLFEMGRWDWAQTNEINFEHKSIAAVVANVAINYIKPIFWEPNKDVMIRTELIGTKFYSLLFKQQVVDKKEIFTQAEFRLGLYDKKNLNLIKVDWGRL